MPKGFNMKLKIIKNEEEYQKALNRVDELFELDLTKDVSLSDELDVIVLLIEKYEEEHWKIDTPDPIEVIKYRMEEMNLKQKDLIPYIGSKSKVSELLNHKISLSLNMIRNLSSALHIPAEVLLKPNLT